MTETEVLFCGQCGADGTFVFPHVGVSCTCPAGRWKGRHQRRAEADPGDEVVLVLVDDDDDEQIELPLGVGAREIGTMVGDAVSEVVGQVFVGRAR